VNRGLVDRDLDLVHGDPLSRALSMPRRRNRRDRWISGAARRSAAVGVLLEQHRCLGAETLVDIALAQPAREVPGALDSSGEHASPTTSVPLIAERRLNIGRD
jgi:hypothetical protein